MNTNNDNQNDPSLEPADFTLADRQNLHNTVADLMARLTEAEKYNRLQQHRVLNTVTAQIAQKKKDAVIFLVEKSATICPYTYRELPFPENLWFGKNVECIVTLFSTKSEIQEALITKGHFAYICSFSPHGGLPNKTHLNTSSKP